MGRCEEKMEISEEMEWELHFDRMEEVIASDLALPITVKDNSHGNSESKGFLSLFSCRAVVWV
mgnify:CR=1 FL=1